VATRRVEVTNLGIVEYEDGLELQDHLRRAVAAGELADQLLLLEHPPVVTMGRSGNPDHLVADPEALAAREIGYFPTGRGGDVTFHGPGQLVGYPIVDLNPDRRDVHRYVRDLEEVLIRTLADFDVSAGRIPGLTGVWVGDLKVAAIGVRISRWITSHGFAFNVDTDLDYFDTIVPCGIRDRGVTSLSRLLGEPVALADVRERVAIRFGDVFDREVVAESDVLESVQVLVWRDTVAEPNVLLSKRTASRGGFWQPVTGRVEAGEAPRQTAIREAAEETGLAGDLTDLDLIRDFRIENEYLGGTGPRPTILREHAFAMRASSDAVTLSPNEHEEHLWTTPERAKELLRWNGNRRALAKLLRMGNRS